MAGGASAAAVRATLTFDVNATWPRTPFVVNAPPRLLHGDLDTAAFLEGWAGAGTGATLAAQCGNGSAAWAAAGSGAAPLRAQAMLQAGGRYVLLDVLGAAVEGGVATLDVSLVREPELGPEGACAALAGDSPLPFYSDCGSASMAVDYFIPGAVLPDAWALVVKIGAGQAGGAAGAGRSSRGFQSWAAAVLCSLGLLHLQFWMHKTVTDSLATGPLPPSPPPPTHTHLLQRTAPPPPPPRPPPSPPRSSATTPPTTCPTSPPTS